MDKIQQLKQKIDWAELHHQGYYQMRQLCDEIASDETKAFRRGKLAGIELIAKTLEDAGKLIEARGVRALGKGD